MEDGRFEVIGKPRGQIVGRRELVIYRARHAID
jgi:hypothetical protein